MCRWNQIYDSVVNVQLQYIDRRARYRILINSEGEIKNGQSRGTGNIWYGTQDEEKQNKITTQHMLDTTMHKSMFECINGYGFHNERIYECGTTVSILTYLHHSFSSATQLP
jgi:hypothetical protein